MKTDGLQKEGTFQLEEDEEEEELEEAKEVETMSIGSVDCSSFQHGEEE